MTIVVIHIGAGKCGSSAIQAFLGSNAQLLRQNGIFVPSNKFTSDESKVTGNHVWYLHNLLQLGGVEAQRILSNNLDKILDDIRPSERRVVIISAENLSASAQFPTLLDGLKQRCDPRVIFYVRRQDDYLISSWHQWYVKQESNFNDWIGRIAGRLGNWSNVLAPWETVFCRENIRVRRYSRKHLLEGDVVHDFIAAAELPNLDYYYEGKESNTSYDESIGHIAHATKDLFTDINDTRLFEMFTSFAGTAAFRNRRGSSLMTLEQRYELLDHYEIGNEKLREAYFSNDDAPLFPPPTQNDVLDISTDQMVQNEIAMLTRVLFGIYREITAMRR